MTHLPQSLHDIFPNDTDLLRRLKADDAHFQQLAARLDGLDAAVHAVDSGDDPASDQRSEELSRERLAVLDEIAARLADARRS